MSAPTDPVTLFETLVSELSESGSFPINASTATVPQPNLTPRQAIAATLWKTNASVDLKGTGDASARPIDPSDPDDLLGQVLSLRAENLQVMALLSGLITALVQAKVIPSLDQVGIMNSVRSQF